MEYSGRCVSISEPIAPVIVATKYRKLGDSPEIRQLARDVLRWECRPYPTMQPPPLAYFVKIDGSSAVTLPMFRQVMASCQLSVSKPMPLLTLILQCNWGSILPPDALFMLLL